MPGRVIATRTDAGTARESTGVLAFRCKRCGTFTELPIRDLFEAMKGWTQPPASIVVVCSGCQMPGTAHNQT